MKSKAKKRFENQKIQFINCTMTNIPNVIEFSKTYLENKCSYDGFSIQGLHPRIVTEGFEAAKEKSLEVLEQVKISKEMDRETLINVARTSLRTKVHRELADILTEVFTHLKKCFLFSSCFQSCIWLLIF